MPERAAPTAEPEDRSNSRSQASPVTGILLWLLVFAAFAPVVLDLGKHWLAHAWPRYSLAFIALLIWCIRRDANAKRLRGLGMTLVVGASLTLVVATLSATIFAARPALAAAVIGLLLLRGTASPRTALLAAWAIPVPFVVVRVLAGRALAHTLAVSTVAGLAWLGLDLEIHGMRISSGGRTLRVDEVNSGLLIAANLLGLGWYSALRRALPWPATLLTLAAFAALALPVQVLALALAACTLSFASADAAAAVLDYSGWVVPLLVVVVWSERAARRSQGERDGNSPG